MARRQRIGQLRVVIALLVALMWVIWALRQKRPQRAGQPTTNTSTIRIATWNLRKFSEGGQHPPDLVEIASIIKGAQFDLVAIQEVQREGQIVEKLRRQLNEPWRHVVSERTGNNERYAFLYRSDRVDLVDGSARLLKGPETAVFDRAPFTGSFRAGEFDFMLLTVHLSYTDVARRKAEASALVGLCRGMVDGGVEKDLIVLGDFNEQHQRGNLKLFEEQGWTRLNRDATNLSSSEVYDNLLIDPRFTNEWTGVGGTWRFDEMDYGNDDKAAVELVSDHRPAWGEFSVGGPDDD
ncbi:MAG TPA: endonuclease/exonuclease/phosphatase family protein [Tepidisphaeraceae bacterium]|nr:endonuclease/exonuclease/phosphatase family protein [Tepidisphaeraceae bacterium]